MTFKLHLLALALILALADAARADTPLRLADYTLAAFSPKDCLVQLAEPKRTSPVIAVPVEYAVSLPQPDSARRCHKRQGSMRALFSEPPPPLTK